MRALIQRVTAATVTVEGRATGAIGSGLLVLAGVKRGDTGEDCEWLAGKIAGLRIFPDDGGRMNRSVAEVGGEVLLVSQFTLYGDARKGRRPSFETAARPEEAIPLLDALKRSIAAAGPRVATGEFGAHMKVELVNDGPVTLMLDSEERRRGRGGDSADSTVTAALDLPASVPAGRFRLLGSESPLQELPLVLASASPRRRNLLRDLGLSFTMNPPDIDESTDLPESPLDRARVLAERKARVVGSSLSECIVLAADTIVELENRVFGKPVGEEDAIRMLRELSGREHRVVTGVCAAHVPHGKYHTRVVCTRVRFRNAEAEEIRRYVETGEPFGKAGAYAIQGLGGLLVAGIEGDYSNVVGLPLGATLDLLEEIVGEREKAGAGRPGRRS
jgi:D-tyrosyl-tRNA(Tyr) deacylase